MKKYFAILALVLGCVFCSQNKVFASDSDYAKTFHSDVTLNQDSSISITETIDYHFYSYEHGIYREIPTNYKTSGGFTRPTQLVVEELYYYQDSVPSVKYDTYERSYSNGYATLKIGDSDTTIIGDYTYVISYKLIYAVNYFPDHDELYLNINGNGWEVPINSVTATIKVPGEITDYVCYGGGSNCTLTKTDSNSMTLVAGPLGVYEGATIAIKMPKGTLANTTSQQRVEFIYANLGFFLPILVLLIAIFAVKKLNVNKKLTVIPNYDVPKGFNPLSAGNLYKKNISNSIITAEIISLAVRGNLRIKQFGLKSYQLEKISEKGITDETELLFYAGLFESGDIVDLKKQNNKMISLVARTKANTEKFLYENGYFSKDARKVISLFVAVGVIGIVVSFFLVQLLVNIAAMSWFIGLLISSAIILIASSKIDKRSALGNEIYYELEGLKLYINTAEERRIEFHNDPKKYIGVFEKLLPYAMIFSLEKKWSKEFEDIYVQQPDWYEGDFNTFNSYLFVNSLGGFNKQLNSAITPTNSSHGFASSSAGSGRSGFGGGGFSGGGFGGGGGGSW